MFHIQFYHDTDRKRKELADFTLADFETKETLGGLDKDILQGVQLSVAAASPLHVLERTYGY